MARAGCSCASRERRIVTGARCVSTSNALRRPTGTKARTHLASPAMAAARRLPGKCRCPSLDGISSDFPEKKTLQNSITDAIAAPFPRKTSNRLHHPHERLHRHAKEKSASITPSKTRASAGRRGTNREFVMNQPALPRPRSLRAPFGTPARARWRMGERRQGIRWPHRAIFGQIFFGNAPERVRPSTSRDDRDAWRESRRRTRSIQVDWRRRPNGSVRFEIAPPRRRCCARPRRVGRRWRWHEDRRHPGRRTPARP